MKVNKERSMMMIKFVLRPEATFIFEFIFVRLKKKTGFVPPILAPPTHFGWRRNFTP